MKKARIKELRSKLRVTQAEFADIVGCSLPAVEHWERGYRCPGDLFEDRLERLWRKVKALEKHNEAIKADTFADFKKEDESE